MRTVLVTVLALALAGCGGGRSEEVVAAFYPIAFAAEAIAGPDVDVRNLTPAGVEPHDVELTPRDAGAVARARLVLYVGGGFQPAVERAVARREGPSIDLLAGLPARRDDPHVWLDPSLYARMALETGRTLERPAQAAAFATRLRALDDEFRRGLARCDQRTFVTSHAAFGYLARRYDLRERGLTGADPEAEPSPRALARLIRLVRQERIRTVFFEPLVSPALARTVARATGAHTEVLDPLEGVSGEDDYFTVMRRNLTTLRKALQCR